MKHNKKIVIRNSIFTFKDFSIFVFLFILFFISFIEIKNYFWTTVVLLFFVFFCIFFIKKIKDRNSKIIIDEKGILLCEEYILISWEKIKKIYFKKETVHIGRYLSTKKYFVINLKNPVTEIHNNEIMTNIDEYSYSEDQIKKVAALYLIDDPMHNQF